MREWLVNALRCPYCFGSVGLRTVIQERQGDISEGLLGCPECEFDFPIVAGIPIIRQPDDRIDTQSLVSERISVKGPRVRDLCRALKSGEPASALRLLLNPLTLNGPLIPRTPALQQLHSLARGPVTEAGGTVNESRQQLIAMLKRRGLMDTARSAVQIMQAPKHALQRAMLPLWRKKMSDFLERHGAELSTVEVIDLYFRLYSNSEIAPYFAYRFSQPRHLAGLSVASAVQQREGLILDLACGAGHMSHYFSYAQTGPRLVGLDRDFFSLYIAKNWMAPQAEFICGEADATLPFADESFAGVYCSDAFCFFLRRAAAVREMVRVSRPDAVIGITRTRNLAIERRESHEFTVEGYQRLFSTNGLKCVLMSEGTLVQQYLARNGLDLSFDDSGNLHGSEYLSVIATRSQQPFPLPSQWTDWPHAVGRLGVNPLYAREPVNGNIEMTIRFPTDWYRYQNASMLEYAAEQSTVPAALVQTIEAGQRPPEAQPLIDRFVLIGMPDRYIRNS